MTWLTSASPLGSKPAAATADLAAVRGCREQLMSTIGQTERALEEAERVLAAMDAQSAAGPGIAVASR
jgi:hypothetical protein